jgi:hypothetical protein
MEGNYISINLPNIITICLAAALGMFVVGAISSGLRQYRS